MIAKTVRVKVVREGATCFLPVPFDPKPVFGKVRAPVRVTVNGHTFRSTLAAMGGVVLIPLRTSNREAAGLEGGETVRVEIALDTAPRTVTPPRDLAAALRAAPPAFEAWRKLSYSHQREYAEAVTGAKKPETRARRIAATVAALRRRGG